MLNTEGAGGHTPSPHTLMFHLHVATRCLAKALAMPSAPDVSRVNSLCHWTSSSLIPWAATCNHCCALQWASISSKVLGSSSSMSTWAANHHAGIPPRGLHSLSGWFTLTTLLSPNHAVYGGVWGLKVLLQVFIIIQ